MTEFLLTGLPQSLRRIEQTGERIEGHITGRPVDQEDFPNRSAASYAESRGSARTPVSAGAFPLGNDGLTESLGNRVARHLIPNRKNHTTKSYGGAAAADPGDVFPPEASRLRSF